MSISTAKKVFQIEIEALKYVSSKLDDTFSKVVRLIDQSSGRVILCGMGKSGHIGKKIFATLVSTGTPSMFIHPSEAFHGDLGMVLPQDIFLAISNSGETDELLRLIPFLKDNNNILVSMTGNPKSSLAKASDYHLDIGVKEEACPLQLAPTSSTTATLVLGDALAVALMKARDFQPENFARFHPGGSLGRKLLGRVADFMRPAVTVKLNDDFKIVLSKLAESRTGIICVCDGVDIKGVITDGDIRKKLTDCEVYDVVGASASEIMSPKPILVADDTKCTDADSLMISKGVNSLIVRTKAGGLFVYQNINRS